MKVLCPQCDRLSDLEQFRVDGSALVVTCSKCGAESRAQSTSSSMSAQVPVALPGAAVAATQHESYVGSLTPPPTMRLGSSPIASNVVVLKTPTTEAVEKAAMAAQKDPFEVPPGLCPKCLAKKPDGFPSCSQCGLIFDRLDQSALEPPDWLAAAWKALLTRWGDETQHDRIRKQAAQTDGLAMLGRLYRLRLVSMPDDPYALRGRDEVVRLASITVVPRAPTELSPPSSRFKAFGIFALLIIVSIGAAMVFRFLMAGRGEP